MKIFHKLKILKQLFKRNNYTQSYRSPDGRVYYQTVKKYSNGIGWTSLALINAGLAEGKGRDKFSWFILSFLLGPFATAYIVFTNSKKIKFE